MTTALRFRLAAAAAVPVAALTALVPAGAPAHAGRGTPSSGAAHQVLVGSLPVGPHARVDYLTGRLLHTVHGRAVTIDVPRRYQSSLELLGRSARGGWVVAYFRTSSVPAVAPSGRVRQIARFWEDYPGASRLWCRPTAA